jgi:hypothetical protein
VTFTRHDAGVARKRSQLGTVVVRAWVEPGASPSDVRARVLIIEGPGADMRELGAAAGLDEVLELVSEGLVSVARG